MTRKRLLQEIRFHTDNLAVVTVLFSVGLSTAFTVLEVLR